MASKKQEKEYQVDVKYKDQVQITKVKATDEKDAELKALMWAVETFRFPAQKTTIIVHQPTS